MDKEMKIIVYSTESCPYCVMAKDFLKKNKVKFIEVDVNRDKKAAVEMTKKSHQSGVPVIDVDGEIIVGFEKERLKQLLKL